MIFLYLLQKWKLSKVNIKSRIVICTRWNLKLRNGPADKNYCKDFQKKIVNNLVREFQEPFPLLSDIHSCSFVAEKLLFIKILALLKNSRSSLQITFKMNESLLKNVVYWMEAEA